MNPNPFLLLNHFTFPCSLLITLRLLLLNAPNYNSPKLKQSGIILETHVVSTFKRINRLGAPGSVRARPAQRAETHAGRGIQANTVPAVPETQTRKRAHPKHRNANTKTRQP